MPPARRTPEQTRNVLLQRSTRTTSGCLEWPGWQVNGYGMIEWNRTNTGAHRVAYELFIGPIPDGLHIDHTCRNRICIEPSHLEAVTQAENNARAAAARGQCRKGGHPLDGIRKNTGGRLSRYCRTCSQIRARRNYAKKMGRAL